MTIEQFLGLSRLTLREEMWVSFEHPDLLVNFATDYYAYLDFNGDVDAVKAIIKKNRLFWEREERSFFEEDDEN